MALLGTRPKPFCFVLMPFSTDFNDVYTYGIKGACDDADVYCERVDEQIFEGSVLERVYNQIARADVVIADMSGQNANVFYEVGYAHALGKRTLLLTRRAEDIPFDLKHFPHIVYNASISDLRNALAKRVRFFAYENPEPKAYELGLELYVERQPLSSGTALAQYEDGMVPNATLTVHNASSMTYQDGDYQIGVIAPPEFSYSRTQHATVTRLPDGTNLHMLAFVETLFPGAYCTAKFAIDSPGNDPHDVVDVIVRVFSNAGSRDFPLRLTREAK